MYLGRIVEERQAADLVSAPLHPYTRALISAIPEADPEVTRTKERFELRSMDIPSLLNRPSGCSFHPRCPFHMEGICDKFVPELIPSAQGGKVACHLFDEKYKSQSKTEVNTNQQVNQVTPTDFQNHKRGEL